VVSASSFLSSGSLADPMLLTLPSLPPPLALDEIVSIGYNKRQVQADDHLHGTVYPFGGHARL
jgi:hypothetical protein